MIQTFCLGRLAADAEVKDVNGKKVLEFRIAVDQGYGDRKTTLWISCNKWGENTTVAQYLLKGTQVHVLGEPSLNTYTNKEGKDVTTLRLNCSQITLCGGAPVKQEQQTPVTSAADFTPPAIDGDLPF